MSIAENLKHIRSEIAAACMRAGRAVEDVQLIAVSKTKPLENILEAAALGQTDFGENYVQEAVDKVQQAPHLNWHFIGRLQSNKVKLVVGRFKLIHSVDRMKLAQVISEQAVHLGLRQDILLQIHIGAEETKAGFLLSEANDTISQCLLLPGIRLRGIMALPPLTDSESQGRSWFRELKDAQAHWRQLYFSDSSDFSHLSMGTTHDYIWAIEEGATFVRIGTAVFGARD